MGRSADYVCSFVGLEEWSSPKDAIFRICFRSMLLLGRCVFFLSSVCVLVKGRNFTRAYLSIVKKLLRLLFFFYFCVSKFTFKNSLFLLVFAIFLLALNYHHHHHQLIDFCYFDFPFFVLGCFFPV